MQEDLKKYKGEILKLIPKTKEEKKLLDNKTRHAYDFYESHILYKNAIIKISNDGYIETIENGILVNISGDWAKYDTWDIFKKPNFLKNHRPCRKDQDLK